MDQFYYPDGGGYDRPHVPQQQFDDGEYDYRGDYSRPQPQRQTRQQVQHQQRPVHKQTQRPHPQQRRSQVRELTPQERTETALYLRQQKRNQRRKRLIQRSLLMGGVAFLAFGHIALTKLDGGLQIPVLQQSMQATMPSELQAEGQQVFQEFVPKGNILVPRNTMLKSPGGFFAPVDGELKADGDCFVLSSSRFKEGVHLRICKGEMKPGPIVRGNQLTKDQTLTFATFKGGKIVAPTPAIIAGFLGGGKS